MNPYDWKMETMSTIQVQTYKDQAFLELDKIIKLFDSDELPAKCAKVLIDAPQKPSSKWSLGNQLLMLCAGTEDGRGFDQWKQVKRYVKKGARAFYILGPIYINKPKEDKLEETESVLVGFKRIPIFRFEDTDGAPLEVYKPRTLPPLLDVAKKWGLEVKYELLGSANGAFSEKSKTIYLATENIGTFFHELGHAAHAKIEKLKPGQDPEQEAIAQLTSCTLSRIYGYNDDSYTIRYVSTYAETHTPRAAAQLALRVLAKVQKVIGLILDDAVPKEN